MSTVRSWLSRLVSLVRPHASTILFIFSILSASVTYVLVQGTTARSLEHHEKRLGVIEEQVTELSSIHAGIATLLERTEQMDRTLSEVRITQQDSNKRLVIVETHWSTWLPAIERRLDRLENLTITPNHGDVRP